MINDKINFNKRIQEQCDQIKPAFDEVMSPLINSLKEEYSKNPNLSEDLMKALSECKDKPIEKKPICSICLDEDANATVVPCGHSNFCYECISSHHINSQNKECPICRNEIMMIIKLYS